jgi:hypothetical protein
MIIKLLHFIYIAANKLNFAKHQGTTSTRQKILHNFLRGLSLASIPIAASMPSVSSLNVQL